MLCGWCVFVLLKQAASCQQGGVKRPEGFEHSRPAKLTVCLDNGMFPLSFTIPPSRSLHTFAKKKKKQKKTLQTRKLLLLLLILHSCQRMSILSLFISSCLYRPLSHLLYSLHRGESTHLPSRGATPLPSISLYSPLGGDWYQHPPPFLSSLSPPSSLYTFPLHLYLCSVTSPLSRSLPLSSSQAPTL